MTPEVDIAKRKIWADIILSQLMVWISTKNSVVTYRGLGTASSNSIFYILNGDSNSIARKLFRVASASYSSTCIVLPLKLQDNSS